MVLLVMTLTQRASPKRLLQYAIFTTKSSVHVLITLPIQSEATVTDDEGTEVTVEEINESITQAIVRPSPLTTHLHGH